MEHVVSDQDATCIKVSDGVNVCQVPMSLRYIAGNSYTNSANPASVSLTVNPQAGNTLVVICGFYSPNSDLGSGGTFSLDFLAGTSGISTISDTNGNTFTIQQPLVCSSPPTTNGFISLDGVWTVDHAKAGATTITITQTFGVNCVMGIAVYEYSGLTGALTSAVVGSSGVNGSGLNAAYYQNFFSGTQHNTANQRCDDDSATNRIEPSARVR